MIDDHQVENPDIQKGKDVKQPTLAAGDDHKFKIIWLNVVLVVYFHIAAVFGLFASKKPGTHLVEFFWVLFNVFGMTVCAHQLFSHRSFKVNKKLKTLLVFMHTTFATFSIRDFVRYHRMHHLYLDTNADPHNSKRGLFFTHFGWLLVEKHPQFYEFSDRINFSDIEADKMLRLQHKYLLPLGLLAGFALPIWASWYFFNESLITAWNYNCFRYLLVFHMVETTNSIAHNYGYRPFNKEISATESLFMGTITFGGGWHNFHHTFPWDYKTSETTAHWCNFSLAFVDFFAWLGWATDLRTASKEMVMKRANRTGDGSRKFDVTFYAEPNKELQNFSNVWGWDDSKMTKKEKKSATVLYKSVK